MDQRTSTMAQPALHEVAERAGDRDRGSTSVLRESLLRTDLVYSPRRGLIDFTVPLFAGYLRRQHPIDSFASDVSIPDDLFRRADELATQFGKSRRELYRKAVADYVARLDPKAVTAALNEIANERQAERHGFGDGAARRSLARSEWRWVSGDGDFSDGPDRAGAV
jgi:predicted transcriptional regulator